MRAINGDTIREPLISFVITNYNYETFVGPCIQSVASQSYGSIEIIVVDDASTDGSIRAIREVERTLSRPFTLIERETNGGQMSAFLEGLQAARGEFVAFVDADDILFTDFAERHVREHLDSPHPASITSSDQVVINEHGDLIAGSMRTVRSKPTSIAFRVAGWVRALRIPSPNQSFEHTSFYIPASANDGREWLWTTTSACVFRRSTVSVAIGPSVADFRICADFFLLHVVHLLGGTIVLNTALGAYRRHTRNHFASNPFLGEGAKSGHLPDGWSWTGLLSRIEGELRSAHSELTAILGEARYIQLLASITPFSRHYLSVRVLAPLGAIAVARYLALSALKSSKRTIGTAARLWSYV